MLSSLFFILMFSCFISPIFIWLFLGCGPIRLGHPKGSALFSSYNELDFSSWISFFSARYAFDGREIVRCWQCSNSMTNEPDSVDISFFSFLFKFWFACCQSNVQVGNGVLKREAHLGIGAKLIHRN